MQSKVRKTIVLFGLLIMALLAKCSKACSTSGCGLVVGHHTTLSERNLCTNVNAFLS